MSLALKDIVANYSGARIDPWRTPLKTCCVHVVLLSSKTPPQSRKITWILLEKNVAPLFGLVITCNITIKKKKSCLLN